jgi:hypothetical protein
MRYGSHVLIEIQAELYPPHNMAHWEGIRSLYDITAEDRRRRCRPVGRSWSRLLVLSDLSSLLLELLNVISGRGVSFAPISLDLRLLVSPQSHPFISKIYAQCSRCR